jgi:hypothetical protein
VSLDCDWFSESGGLRLSGTARYVHCVLPEQVESKSRGNTNVVFGECRNRVPSMLKERLGATICIVIRV